MKNKEEANKQKTKETEIAEEMKEAKESEKTVESGKKEKPEKSENNEETEKKADSGNTEETEDAVKVAESDKKEKTEEDEDAGETESSEDEAEEPEEAVKPEKKKKSILPVFAGALLIAGVGAAGWYGYRYTRPESKGDRAVAACAYEEALTQYRAALASDPGNVSLREKLRSVYLTMSGTFEINSDWIAAYGLMTDALTDIPDDALIKEHREWIAGHYVRSVLREAHLLGETKQAVEVLENGYAQIPDERIQSAIDKLYEARWKETSRAIYIGEEAIESYLVRNYDETGNEIWQDMYNSDGSTAYSIDFYYEDGRIKGTLRREGEDAVSYGEWNYENGGGMYTEYRLGGEPVYAISYLDDGLIEFYIIYNPDESVKDYIGYEYNEFGDLICKSEYGDDDIPDIRYVYEYNESGLLQKETKYDNAEHVLEYSESTYDAEGRLSEVSTYTQDGSLSSVEKYEYDADGHCAYYELKNAEDVTLAKNCYEYDANGNLTSQTIYAPYDVRYRIFEYEYDADGNLQKETEYYGDGILKHWTEYTYEYYELP